jgi:hypothetical protein
MKNVVMLMALIGGSIALASEPGQPLDCSDWVFLEPGMSCTQFICPSSDPDDCVNGNAGLVFDNEGRMIRIRTRSGGTCGSRYEVVAFEGEEWRPIAFIDRRCGGDAIRQNSFHLIEFSATAGRLAIRMLSEHDGAYEPVNWVAFLDGMTPLAEILQSYSLGGSSFFARVPVFPEGLTAADRFDSYSGDLVGLNFGNATGLQCDYRRTGGGHPQIDIIAVPGLPEYIGA